MPSNDLTYDLVGLGFGPANIAIAAALTERWEGSKALIFFVFTTPQKIIFFEKHHVFQWHPGMLLPDARMQISFMKDLATLRNPKSPYTFLSYLHSQNRLLPFINRGSTIPSRKEFADYLGWAAAKVQSHGVEVAYGHEITKLTPTEEGLITVEYRDLAAGDTGSVTTKNLVISPGAAPRIPGCIAPVARHPNVLHSSSYATSIDTVLESLPTQRPARVAVIGSGQSAAEVVLNLRSRLADIPTTGRHEVDMLIRKGALRPSDDSPFQNEIFDPAATDAWFGLASKQARGARLQEYKPTNYGVVNPRTLDTLYEVMYDQQVDTDISHRLGSTSKRTEARVNIRPYTEITTVTTTPAKILPGQAGLLLSVEQREPVEEGRALTITSQNLVDRLTAEDQYDVIIYATGYERNGWVNLLKDSGIGKWFGVDSQTQSVDLIPAAEGEVTMSRPSSPQFSTPSSASSTAPSTPPDSPGGSTIFDTNKVHPHEIKISRAYQLLPCADVLSERGPKARIYVQGVEEQTHGLSDTLLSVMGVRAGEVVDDLERA